MEPFRSAFVPSRLSVEGRHVGCSVMLVIMELPEFEESLAEYNKGLKAVVKRKNWAGWKKLWRVLK